MLPRNWELVNLGVIESGEQTMYYLISEHNGDACASCLLTVKDIPETAAPDMRTDNFLCSQNQRLERIDDTCDELFGYHATHDSLDQMTDKEIKKLGIIRK